MPIYPPRNAFEFKSHSHVNKQTKSQPPNPHSRPKIPPIPSPQLASCPLKPLHLPFPLLFKLPARQPLSQLVFSRTQIRVGVGVSVMQDPVFFPRVREFLQERVCLVVWLDSGKGVLVGEFEELGRVCCGGLSLLSLLLSGGCAGGRWRGDA